jgi:hypothetical protein
MVLEAGATSAQATNYARLSSRRKRSLAIRVWTLCIIRSAREQRQTESSPTLRRRILDGPSSIMEPVAQFDEHFAGVIPVKATKGLTVVEIHPAVGNVQGIQRCRDTLAEVLANREIEGGVLG